MIAAWLPLSVGCYPTSGAGDTCFFHSSKKSPSTAQKKNHGAPAAPAHCMSLLAVRIRFAFSFSFQAALEGIVIMDLVSLPKLPHGRGQIGGVILYCEEAL
jgi:hypothetical protein